MANLEELQAAILRNKQASGNMAGLDEQYTRAAALRDTPQAQANRYGTLSPLQLVANSMKQGRGQRDLRSIAPQREQARTDIAEGEAAVAGEGVRLKLAKEKLEADKFAEEQAGTAFDQDIATSEEERAQLESEAGSGDSLTFSDGKNKIPVTVDSQGNLIVAADNAEAGVKRGDPVPDGYTEVDTVGQRGGYIRGIKGSTYDKLSEESNTLRKFNETVADYEPRFSQVGGILTTPLQNAIKTLSGQDLLKFANNENLTKDARDAAQWWARFKMEYELPERHKIFGATLTNNESASWADAVNAIQAMPASELKKRLARLQANLGVDFSNRINTWSKAYSNNPQAVEALGYMAQSSGLTKDEKGNYQVQQFGEDEAVGQESAPASANAPPRELTPEEGIEYGKMIQGFKPDTMTFYKSITDPNEARAFLDHMWAGRNSMSE